MRFLKILPALFSCIAGQCDLATVECDITTGFTVTINETCRALDHPHVRILTREFPLSDKRLVPTAPLVKYKRKPGLLIHKFSKTIF